MTTEKKTVLHLRILFFFLLPHSTLCETIVFFVLVTNDWRENRFCYNHFCQLEHHRRCKGFSGRLMWSVLTGLVCPPCHSDRIKWRTASVQISCSTFQTICWGLLFVQKDTDLHLRHTLDSTSARNNHGMKFLHYDSKICGFWLLLIEVVPLLVTDVWNTVHMTGIDKTKKSLWVCPTFFPSPLAFLKHLLFLLPEVAKHFILLIYFCD